MTLAPISEIHTVHKAYIGIRYAQAVSYLKELHPNRRRSYASFEGSVFELDDDQSCLSFQNECLLPEDNSHRTRVLLLFSNAHPGSIKNGMFHTAESGVANLWTDLWATGVFAGDRAVMKNPLELRRHCLHGNYSSCFILGFATYWIFPTFDPKHLKELFGKAREPCGFEDTKKRLNHVLETWRPHAIVCFNGEVFANMTGLSIKGYTRHLENQSIQSLYHTSELSFPTYLTFPAGWRYVQGADIVRQGSLRRIFECL